MVHVYTKEYYSAIKKNEIMPSAATTWMDLETITLSKSEKERQIYDIIFMWNLKYATTEPICETGTDSQT